MDRYLINIVQLGIGFLVVFTAFQSSTVIQQTVIESAVNASNSTNDGLTIHSGYISLAIFYAAFTVSIFVVPPIIGLIGPIMSMAIGVVGYGVFFASFLKLMGWLMYICSVFLGFGAAMIWVGQGNYFTLNSNDETVGRNSGIFWVLYQSSFLFGSLFLYFMFRGKETIDEKVRIIVYSCFTCLAVLGLIVLFLLRKPRQEGADEKKRKSMMNEEKFSAMKIGWKDFVHTFKMLSDWNMLLLTVVFFYSGIELCFFSGIYGTCLANTNQFEPNAKALLGLNGIFIGVGEIIGGTLFGLIGSRTIKQRYNAVIILALVVHLGTFVLIFINTPDLSPLYSTDSKAYLSKSNKILAIFGSFLLGFADSSWNTQIFAILGYNFPDDGAPVFALFNGFQSLAAAGGSYASTSLRLRWQLLILCVGAIAAAFCFLKVQRNVTGGSAKVKNICSQKF